ncbi:hypothetical protein BN961_02348 [Afipia felis]|uniref:Uncharacterized protein n=1 Tax=Afipia felis TaxID=1035 RepID=A0A090N7N8_AFIFE|nr:hypothetical protein BN961_02348 [Afipia felis]
MPLVALGGDGLHTAVGQFSFAGESLRLGAHMRGTLALLVHPGARGGQLSFGLVACWQFGDGLRRHAMGAVRLGAVGGKTCLRFRERGAARGVAIDFALGARVTFARGIGIALRGTGGFTRGRFGGGGKL